jgi:hypothetical protein
MKSKKYTSPSARRRMSNTTKLSISFDNVFVVADVVLLLINN